jgi:hypothetical protein
MDGIRCAGCGEPQRYAVDYCHRCACLVLRGILRQPKAQVTRRLLPCRACRDLTRHRSADGLVFCADCAGELGAGSQQTLPVARQDTLFPDSTNVPGPLPGQGERDKDGRLKLDHEGRLKMYEVRRDEGVDVTEGCEGVGARRARTDATKAARVG